MKRLFFVLFCCGQIVFLCGCRMVKKEEGKKELEFQIVSGEEIPEEMRKQIEAQGGEPFWITYGDQEKLYAGRGYGRKETSGYRVCVDSCRESEEAVYIHTSLLGPSADESENAGCRAYDENIQLSSEPSDIPYIVVSMKQSRKPVVFQGK